ncbi:hypothetical protein [Spirosoma rigui]|uniref:hypothetical protein n=1 Tax=Spirosoma rigui TaxID=564064 RepID=UPI0009B03B37|nr:hypothetical protein [Spirosoma rigui]
MKTSIVGAVCIVSALLAGFCRAQQLQILRPDGTVFESIAVGKYMVVELPDRFHAKIRYQGQLVRVSPETFTMSVRRKLEEIPVSEIRALRRVSKFGAWARRSARFIVPATVATVSDVTSDLAGGGTKIRQLAVPALASLSAGAIVYGLLHLPLLKKADQGYTFRTVN